VGIGFGLAARSSQLVAPRVSALASARVSIFVFPQMPQLAVRVDAVGVAVGEGEADGVATDEVGVVDGRLGAEEDQR